MCNDCKYGHEDEVQNCGCPLDYHTADCPHRTGSHGPATKDEWLEILERQEDED